MNIGSIIGIVIMVAGLIGMIVCSKKQRVNPALQPVSIALFIGVLVGGFLFLRGQGIIGNAKGKDAIAREVAYQEARGRVIGEFIKDAKDVDAGKKILFITDPGYVKAEKKDKIAEALIKSLEKACGRTVEVAAVAVPENAEEDGGDNEYMTAKAVNELLAKHTDAGIVIFNNNLPENPQQISVFKTKNGPKVILIGRGGADGKFITAKMKSGELLGLVMGKPGVKSGEPAASDYKKAFDYRYVLISKDNLESKAELLK